MPCERELGVRNRTSSKGTATCFSFQTVGWIITTLPYTELMSCRSLLRNKKVVAKSLVGSFRRISPIGLIGPIRPILQVKSHERQGYEQRASCQCDEEVRQSGTFQSVMARQA